jgi:hypothetical protein
MAMGLIMAAGGADMLTSPSVLTVLFAALVGGGAALRRYQWRIF